MLHMKFGLVGVQMYSQRPLGICSEIVVLSEFLYLVTGENLWYSKNCIKFKLRKKTVE